MAFYSTLRQKLRVLASTPYNWTLPAADAAGTINSDGSGTLSIATAVAPGGSNTQVQFNDSSSFGGDAGLTYNKRPAALTVVGDLVVDTDTLFVDASEDKVGIGAGSPTHTLHVSDTTEALIALQRDSGTNGHGVGFNFLLGNSGSATAAEQYGTLNVAIADNTATTEDALGILNLKKNGAMAEMWRVFGASGCLAVGATDDYGKLNVAKDTDVATYFGRGYISSTGTSMTSDQVYFGHVDCEAAANYAVMQTAAGATNLNAKSGQAIAFNVNASALGSWTATGLHIGDNSAPDSRCVVEDAGGSHAQPLAILRVDDQSLNVLSLSNLTHSTDALEGARFTVNNTGQLYIYAPDNGTAAGNIYWLTDETTRLTLYASGGDLRLENDMTIVGSLSKGSGSFLIPHPHPSKTETHNLAHSFIEGPRCDLIYRGTVTLSNGSAEVDLEAEFGFTPGTWELLCRNEQCYTTNETGWHHVRGLINGSTLTINCEEECDDVVSWMVVSERKDSHILGANWTDEEGRPILAPLKPDPAPDD